MDLDTTLDGDAGGARALRREDLLELAGRHGTPLYVYDATVIRRQMARLREALGGVADVRIHYAAKALTTLPVLELMRRLGCGLDAVSIGELEMGLRAGFAAEEMMFTPNGVAWEEVERAVALGVQVNLDNLPQLEAFGRAFPGRKVCVRINPNIMAGGNRNISVGHSRSKFGISVRRLPELLELVRRERIAVNGVHMHTGSDILDLEVFLQAVDVLLGVAREFPEVEYLDFGSGFKVAYKPGDVQTDMAAFGRALQERVEAFGRVRGRPVAMVFEPGKFLVSEAGHLLVRATVVKAGDAETFVQVDSGLNHLLRPMLYGSYHHIENLSNPEGEERPATVVGYICETDTFATDRPVAQVRAGDVLRFANAGAYGMTMASQYNARVRPAEVLWTGRQGVAIRRRETLEDLLATTLEPGEDALREAAGE